MSSGNQKVWPPGIPGFLHFFSGRLATRHGPTVGSEGGVLSYERGTTVGLEPGPGFGHFQVKVV